MHERPRRKRSGRRKLWGIAAISSVLIAVAGGAVFSQTSAPFVVLSWNDLGMHCANKDFSALAILPPFNTLHAQVIKKGLRPSLVTQGVTLAYDVPGNTYSFGKTNFWQYVQPLFGIQLPPDTGFTGRGLSGAFSLDPVAGRFQATGIPITPYTDQDLVLEDPYQLARVSLIGADGTLLAQTQPVIPVSNEINCSGCHVSESSIINGHPNVPGFDPTQPILCAKCHASNALGTTGLPQAGSLSERIHRLHNAKTNDCYACHPGPQTRCLRGVMGTEVGLTCQDCHGNMANIADSITQGRRPWLDEPRCGTCHAAQFSEEPGKLYRDSRGHGGLYCSACHGSPHAILPSREPRDNEQNIALQGFAGTLQNCTVCHDQTPAGKGPHGLRGSQ